MSSSRSGTPSCRPWRAWGLVGALLAATCAAAAAAVPAGGADGEESWWLCKLGSADRVARVRAAEALAAMRCFRAVPGIVRVIAEDPEEGIAITTVGYLGTRCSKGGFILLDTIEKAEATPVVFALWTMGEPAVPALRRCLGEKRLDARTRGILRRLLDRSEPLTRRGPVPCK